MKENKKNEKRKNTKIKSRRIDRILLAFREGRVSFHVYMNTTETTTRHPHITNHSRYFITTKLICITSELIKTFN